MTNVSSVMETEDDSQTQTLLYVSPLAEPLLDGKALERSLKLIKKAFLQEKAANPKNNKNGKKSSLTENSPLKSKKANTWRCLHRGVQEVTKSIRKGATGMVFLACDSYPLDVIAHLPILCEESDVLYAYAGSRKTLGAACRSQRPTSVLMVVRPTDTEKFGTEVNDNTEDKTTGSYSPLYNKVYKIIKKGHPYM